MFISRLGGWKITRNLMQAFHLTSRLINIKQPNTIITLPNYRQPCLHDVMKENDTYRFWVLQRSKAARVGHCTRSGRCFRKWDRLHRWLWLASHTSLYKHTCKCSLGIIYKLICCVFLQHLRNQHKHFTSDHVMQNHLQIANQAAPDELV